MASLLTPVIKASTFAASLDVSVDLTGADGLLVQVWNRGASVTPINSVVIDPAGVNLSMTGETELSGITVLGVAGRFRSFKYQGTLPTGTITVRVTLNDANCKPYVWAQPTSGFGTISAIVQAAGGGSSASATVTSATGRTVVSFLCVSAYADGSTITGTGTTTSLRRVVSTDGGGSNDLTGAILSTTGAASTSVTATGSTTFGNWAIAAWSLTPGGGATLATRKLLLGVGA